MPPAVNLRSLGMLLVMLSLVMACADRSDSRSHDQNESAPVELSIAQAIDRVASLPEVQAWKQYIQASTAADAWGVVDVVPGQHPLRRNGQEYWKVHFYEAQDEFRYRWDTFLVRLDGQEILVSDTLQGYIPYQQWRRTKKTPVIAVAESDVSTVSGQTDGAQ